MLATEDVQTGWRRRQGEETGRGQVCVQVRTQDAAGGSRGFQELSRGPAHWVML